MPSDTCGTPLDSPTLARCGSTLILSLLGSRGRISAQWISLPHFGVRPTVSCRREVLRHESLQRSLTSSIELGPTILSWRPIPLGCSEGPLIGVHASPRLDGAIKLCGRKLKFEKLRQGRLSHEGRVQQSRWGEWQSFERPCAGTKWTCSGVLLATSFVLSLIWCT